LVDPTAHDALFCSVDMRGMGVATDFYNKDKDIGRAEQDEYAAMSHDRAGDRSKERAARRRDRRRRGAPAQG
jgi:acetyl-CoA C-acetyltransferase